MKSAAFLLFALAVTGCESNTALDSTPSPTPTKATPPEPPKPPPTSKEPKQAIAVETPTVPSPMPAPAYEEPKEDPPIAAPPLPEGVKPLNKARTLFIENRGKSRRLWVLAEVVNRDVPLEVFMCRKMTKEHEAIVAADLDARDIHMALLAIGATPGKPVQFVPKYVPASGQQMRVLVHYLRDGKPVTHPAQEWITDVKTKKSMAEDWVFAGSRFLKDPDNPDAQPFYTANNGEVISLSNFVDSMLDVPVASSGEEAGLLYRTNTEKIPPRKSGVYVIIELGGST